MPASPQRGYSHIAGHWKRPSCIPPHVRESLEGGSGPKYASDELQRVCCCELHGFATAYAGLLPLARSIRIVEESDLPHARVRNNLTRFCGKAGRLLFEFLAHSGRPSYANLACSFLSERQTRTCARVPSRMARTSDRTRAPERQVTYRGKISRTLRAASNQPRRPHQSGRNYICEYKANDV